MNITPHINRQAIPNVFPVSARRFCNGVCCSSASISIEAIFPTSVSIPVAVTIANALPRVTLQEDIAIFFISDCGVRASQMQSASFSISFVSPVSDDSSTNSPSHFIRRQSAHIISP